MADKPQKKKAEFGPNEASAWRWVGYFVAAWLGSNIIGGLAMMPLKGWTMTGSYVWLPDMIRTMGTFAVSFVLCVLLLRWICKTSFRDLVLGAGNSLDWSMVRKVALAYLCGFALSFFGSSFVPGSSAALSINPIGAGAILVNFIVCLALVWMQTTYEEILYRCVFLRATCKNNIRASVPCIVVGIVANLIFMSVHLYNPEVTSQQSLLTVCLMASTYFIAGFGMYISDVVFGNCVPGIIIHWMNNFIIFAFFTQETIALSSGALFVSATSSGALATFVGTVLLYLPIFVLLVMEARKKKQLAA